MNTKTLLGNKPRAIAVVAAIALFGSNGAGFAKQQAPQQVELTSTSAARNAEAPSFTPSDDAAFEAAFARYDTPAQPELPDHAVDITTIEPAAPPAATSLGTGVASYYGRQFHGRRTANGESFDMNEMTAAHRTLPFGSRVRVTNTSNGRSVIVRINDRGPFIRGREIDVSRAAAEQIGMIARGHSNVELELIES